MRLSKRVVLAVLCLVAVAVVAPVALAASVKLVPVAGNGEPNPAGSANVSYHVKSFWQGGPYGGRIWVTRYLVSLHVKCTGLTPNAEYSAHTSPSGSAAVVGWTRRADAEGNLAISDRGSWHISWGPPTSVSVVRHPTEPNGGLVPVLYGTVK